MHHYFSTIIKHSIEPALMIIPWKTAHMLWFSGLQRAVSWGRVTDFSQHGEPKLVCHDDPVDCVADDRSSRTKKADYSTANIS